MTSRDRCIISRRYPERPVLGVGAIIIEGDRVLMVERGREPLKGYWSLPGGVVETGERLDAAIRREVLEETGLTVDTVSVAEIFERIMPDAEGRPEYHYVLIDYLCRITGGTPVAGDDVSKVDWFPIDRLCTLQITEGTQEVIERVFKQNCEYEAR
jgi:8-oxo-dGTP diphosphatase